MRKKIICAFFMAAMALPSSVYAASDSWWRPSNWFNKKSRSTTVTGVVDTVVEKVVTFKTLDGQTLYLIGDKAEKVAEARGSKLRVFGNIYKPDQKYPSGAIQVRNFKVVDEKLVVQTEAAKIEEPAAEPQIYGEPQPYSEPEPYMEPQPVAEPAAEPVAEPAPADTTVMEVTDDEDEPPFVADESEEEKANESVVEQTYVVVSGDTLGKISQKIYGTTAQWKKIAEKNGITNPKYLKVGMTLSIP